MHGTGHAGQRADSSNNLITADRRPLAGNRSAKTTHVVSGYIAGRQRRRSIAPAPSSPNEHFISNDKRAIYRLGASKMKRQHRRLAITFAFRMINQYRRLQCIPCRRNKMKKATISTYFSHYITSTKLNLFSFDKLGPLNVEHQPRFFLSKLFTGHHYSMYVRNFALTSRRLVAPPGDQESWFPHFRFCLSFVLSSAVSKGKACKAYITIAIRLTYNTRN